MSLNTSLFFLSLIIPNKKPEWTKKSDECVETKDKQKVDDIKKGQTKKLFFTHRSVTLNILLFASSSSSNDKHIVKKRERIIGSNANTKYNVLVFVFFSRVFLRQCAAENEVARLLLRFFVFFFFFYKTFEFVVFVGRRRKEEEKVCPPGVEEECRQKHEREDDDDEAKKQR